MEPINNEEENKKYYDQTQLMLEVSARLNNHTATPKENIEYSLQFISGPLKSDATLIFANNHNTCRVKYSGLIPYVNNYQEIKEFARKMDLNTDFPLTVHHLNNDEVSDIIAANYQSALCKQADVKSMSLVPIVTYDNIDYILCSINPQENTQLLRFFATFLADAIKNHITEEKTHILRISDALTGLYNRDYFNEIINQGTKELFSLGIIMIDLNRLKYVNDHFGHEYGDKYITTVASVLKQVFHNELTFRIGGDEFTIVCRNRSKEYIELLISTLQAMLKKTPLQCSEEEFVIPEISLGFAYSIDNPEYEELNKEADRLMYEDKEKYYERNNFERRK